MTEWLPRTGGQEKAFDRVDWKFLSRTLEAMGFGPSFRQWILLFYTDIESAVMVNGWTSLFFQPSRGVRQGCPLSPLLYVLCAEVLACSLRSAPGIVGVQLPNSAQELRGVGICRRHHYSHQHRLFASRGIRGLP